MRFYQYVSIPLFWIMVLLNGFWSFIENENEPFLNGTPLKALHRIYEIFVGISKTIYDCAYNQD